MNEKTLRTFRKWFHDYVGRFEDGPEEVRWNVRLKKDHTAGVCREIVDIGRSLSLSPEDLCLAEVAALFHDVGRFEQFSRYRTLVDHQSEDHARLGLKILDGHDVLRDLSAPEKELIKKIISYHNRARLPQSEDPQCLLFSRLLRDADKLDIWRVVTDYYRDPRHDLRTAFGLDLPDTPGISPEVFQDIMAGHVATKAHVRNINDFKLFQLCWIFDVTYPRTFQLIKERNYLQKLIETIPPSPRLTEISAMVHATLEKKLAAF